MISFHFLLVLYCQNFECYRLAFGSVAQDVIAPVEEINYILGAGNRLDSVLIKLEKSIEEGDYYQALQMYKTLYSRYYPCMLFFFLVG
jgi:hypothetical protein